MKSTMIIDEIELDQINGQPSIVAMKGRFVSKERIPEFDALCGSDSDEWGIYNQRRWKVWQIWKLVCFETKGDARWRIKLSET